MLIESKLFHHVWTFQLVSQLSVVMSCPDSRNNCHLGRPMFHLSDPLCFFHQHCSIALMLELIRISTVNRHY